MHPKLMDWEGERVPKNNEIWMLACIKKSLKNKWFRRSEFQENHEKNDSKNHVFFACVLKSILERFGGGFWERFGTSLASLGALLSNLSLFF